jgi:hypothetical protein
MKRTLLSVALLVVMSATLAYSQTPSKIRRTPDGHPDLSGTWAFGLTTYWAHETRGRSGHPHGCRSDCPAQDH